MSINLPNLSPINCECPFCGEYTTVSKQNGCFISVCNHCHTEIKLCGSEVTTQDEAVKHFSLPRDYIQKMQAAYGELFRQKEQLQAEIACYRKSTNVDFVKLRNDLNDIFKSIREELGDNTVCGLCQFDGDFSCGESGYSITECPGFEKDDCFELKADFLEKYFKKGVKQ